MVDYKSILPLLPKHAIGLDISDNSIEALELERKFSKLTVVAYARKKLPPGLVENGQVLDKEKLVNNIKDLLISAIPDRFKSKDVILSIPESKTFIHLFRLPIVIFEENVGESVQYEAEATIPISFEQAYYDYEIVAREKDYQDILYVTSLKEIVDDYREVVLKAGLNPVVFEAESMSLARALVHGEQATGSLIVDIGSRTTIISIYHHQGIHYSHNIKVGGYAFTKQVKESLLVSENEAARLMKSIGLVKEQLKGKGVYNIEPLVQEIAKAVNQAIDYYRKSKGGSIGRIILCGGASLVPGIKDYLRSKISVDIEMGKPLQGLQFDPLLFGKQPEILFSTVIGLARRGVDQDSVKSGINLIAHEKAHKRFQFSKIFSKQGTEPKDEKKLVDRLAYKIRAFNKRTLILWGVFIILVIFFIVILILSQASEEPLIQFQKYNYPAGPVEY